MENDKMRQLLSELDERKAENERVVALNHQQFGMALQKNREIDQLKAENKRLAALLECAKGDLKQAMQIIEKLTPDAERYRWLRDSSESIHQFYLSTPIWFTGVKFSKDNVDNTIDAAMNKEG